MADADYPASWYAATRDSSPARAPLAGRVETDVAVVGGGFAGLHTARLLATKARKVVLVERRRVGWGASGRNGGFVGAGFAERSGALIDRLGLEHARRLYAQSQRGVAIVRSSLDELGRPDLCMGPLLMGSGKLTVSRTDQGAGLRRSHARPRREARRQLRALGDRRGAHPDRHRALPPGDPRSAVLPHPSAEPGAGARPRHRAAWRTGP